ncbi:hypothetical protein [Streptomyces kanamyceticus]|uniref:hypothetical protein n=1 Tax=Streptomyces kanamyceticus TaxID=1967 RepID=UPI001CC628D0|nr:hypothetical protein [Streptomyces kanamyceticus]
MNVYRGTGFVVGALLAVPRLALRTADAALDAVVREVFAAVVRRLEIDDVVARVDVDRVVERVDVDAVVRRVDIDAVVDRIDLVSLVVDVLAEIDVQQIAREAGSGMTRETVEAVRERGIRADRIVDHFADRLLRRTGGARAAAPRPGPVRPV